MLLVLQGQVDLHHPCTTLEQREVATCTGQTMLVEDTVHTCGEELPTESSSTFFKYTIIQDSWDTQDPPYPTPPNIEPREPLELRMCMVSDM